MHNKTSTVITSRFILSEAEYNSYILDYEPEGFLSSDYGFLPRMTPKTHFSESHQLWDELAATLPDLYKHSQIRNTFDKLTVLSAGEDALHYSFLYRAATVLGIFAHAYYWLEPLPPKKLPSSILTPWKEVCRRLKRNNYFLSYADLILYNWQFKDPTQAQNRSFENLNLLVETVGLDAERIFYLKQTEMAAVSAPMVLQSVLAQEASVNDDERALKKQLVNIIKCVLATTDIFRDISANDYAPIYANPIHWGRAVAPLSVSWRKDVKGASGTSSPIFHLLDVLLSRKYYRSLYGQDQLNYRINQLGKAVAQFLNGIEEISIREYIDRKKDKELSSLFNYLVDVYAGNEGLLSIHRRKVYGYLVPAFAIGRTITAGGSKAMNIPIQSQDWRYINDDLQKAENERFGAKVLCDYTYQFKKTDLNHGANEVKISFDVKQAGMYYKPGSSIRMLPKNSDHLIKKTCHAMGASGEELVELTEFWREKLVQIGALQTHSTVMKLTDLLAVAKIRPLDRDSLKTLYAITHIKSLKLILDNFEEDQYELWDIFILIKEAGYNCNHFLKARAWERECLSNILVPAIQRFYSIANAPNKNGFSDNLDILVAKLQYQTTGSEQSQQTITRKGSVTSILDEDRMSSIPIKISQYQDLKLVENPKKNIIMFAAGVGISPFLSFMDARSVQNTGQNWLFWSVKHFDDMLAFEQLAHYVGNRKLLLDIAITREDTSYDVIKSNQGFQFKKQQGYKSHIQDIVLISKTKETLWKMMNAHVDSPDAGYFYICGGAGFVKAMIELLKRIVKTYRPNEAPEHYIASLIGNERLFYEAFTPFRSKKTVEKGEYQYFCHSEVAKHNNQAHGYWIILNDEVYDFTEFMHYHPGGDIIIKSYAGVDATQAFKDVNHHQFSSIISELALYKIGGVKKINFPDIWKPTIVDNNYTVITLSALYNSIVNYCELVTKATNMLILEIDNLWHSKDSTLSDPIKKLGNAVITLDNFFSNHLKLMIGTQLIQIWVDIIFLFNSEHSINTAKEKIDNKVAPLISQSHELILKINSLGKTISHDKAKLFNQTLASFYQHMVNACMNIKSVIISILVVFEQHETVKLDCEVIQISIEHILDIVITLLQDFINIDNILPHE